MNRGVQHILLVSGILFAASGAQCSNHLNRFYTAPRPQVLPATPTLAQVIEAVNANSARVQTLVVDEATVSVPMTPSLSATINVDRPRRFHLRAESRLAGPGADLGSNDELFWFWVGGFNPTPLFFCRHEQYAGSATARQIVPVAPEWFIEALGITGFDPTGVHQGPVNARNGRLEIRSQLNRPEGQLTKVTVVDAQAAWVLEQHLYDASGVLLASAKTSRHQVDVPTGATLPRRIEVYWPATQFNLTLDVHQLRVNQSAGDPAQIFALPNNLGAQLVDLADPRNAMPAAATPVAPLPAQPNAVSPTTWQTAPSAQAPPVQTPPSQTFAPPPIGSYGPPPQKLVPIGADSSAAWRSAGS